MIPDAKNAILILKPLLDSNGPASLAYWTTPNVILTLSGARAYCNGVFWDDNNQSFPEKWNVEIKNSSEVLQKHWTLSVLRIGIEKSRSKEKYASFELVSEAGLKQVIRQTKLLNNAILDVLLKQASLEQLLDKIMLELRVQNKLKDYSYESMNHIAFGILLGYPDEAIIGSVIYWQQDDPFAEPLIDADIRGAKYYVCPQPIYTYPRMLISNPSITRNEHLWSKILKDYYTSDFHRQLESKIEFQQMFKELGNQVPR